MKILLSIKPEFADKIFSGIKRYEYRKSAFKRTEVTIVMVYSTMPVGQIIGEFDIEEVLCQDPLDLWHSTQDYAGIDEDFFLEYFRGKEQAIAFKIGNVRLYEKPINPKDADASFVPPQSFRYIPSHFGMNTEALFPDL